MLFFFNDTATTEIYTLSLHDALPILAGAEIGVMLQHAEPLFRLIVDEVGHEQIAVGAAVTPPHAPAQLVRSEEHTSELQSRLHLVCRLLLEKKKRLGPQRHDDQSATH